MSLGLDDCVDVLGVDHAQHPAAEDSRGSRIHSAALKQTGGSALANRSVSEHLQNMSALGQVCCFLSPLLYDKGAIVIFSYFSS